MGQHLGSAKQGKYNHTLQKRKTTSLPFAKKLYAQKFSQTPSIELTPMQMRSQEFYYLMA
ncbi:MAG: hypothetical protein EB066_00615 [Betaproteobacteria bacterium]|nr:hypothetical protein [Betaproteobacteria bacterium]NBY32784.1 hypothetical protein [Betaproteobacteria bacterium]NDF04931.1 hypothetical protein [Betaproteobacteria bacterium]